MKNTIIILSLFTLCRLGFSQTTCDSLKSLKNITYGFDPSQLSDSSIQIKSKELDEFWKVAQRNPQSASICLSDMINSELNDPYFCFDASNLLLNIDTTTNFISTIINGLSKSNLEGIQLAQYLYICKYIGDKGFDISVLSNKLLGVNAYVYLEMHALNLNTIDASLFLYNAIPIDKAESALIDLISKGSSISKHNASVVLNILSTDNGDAFLNKLIEQKQLSDSTITFIKNDRKNFTVKAKGRINRTEIINDLNSIPEYGQNEFYGFAGNEELITSACKVLTGADIDLIRRARSKCTPGISDESLSEYFALTRILMTVRSRKN